MAEPSEKPVVVDLCVERLKRSVMELHEIRKWVEQVPELAGTTRARLTPAEGIVSRETRRAHARTHAHTRVAMRMPG